MSGVDLSKLDAMIAELDQHKHDAAPKPIDWSKIQKAKRPGAQQWVKPVVFAEPDSGQAEYTGLFGCHACGMAWGTGEAGTKAHRAACPQYDNFCAKLMAKPAGPVRIDTSFGPIRITADPTLKPNEVVMVQLDDRVPMNPTNYAKLEVLLDRNVMKLRAARGAVHAAGVDPLDVKHGGVKLSYLLKIDEERRREGHPNYRTAWARLTDAQRAAVSAHWSAQLRAKAAASTAADKARETSVVVDLEDW